MQSFKKKFILTNDSLVRHLVIFGVVTLLLCFKVNAQSNNRIDITLTNSTLKELISIIERKSDYRFLYDANNVNVSVPVSVNYKGVTVDQILKENFSSFAYEISGNQIVIKNKPKIATGGKVISGNIKDEGGDALVGVNITVEGANIGTNSDLEGNFSIDATEGSTLIFSYIGYEIQRIKVGVKTNLQIILKEDKQTLDQVVVIGYGTIRKKDLTGAVSSISQKELPPAANTSVANMLSGRATGLTITQKSAKPGGGLDMQIRGSATGRSPLIVIDGFAQTPGNNATGAYWGETEGSTENSLSSINPNDIESIQILKDASSTSIYGARAAGGVILVTTKRGKAGKTTVNYKGSTSVQYLYGLPNMLGPKDFMIEANEVIKETWMRDNLVYPYGTKELEQAMRETLDAGKSTWVNKYSEDQIDNPPIGTNWLDHVTRMGSVQEHNLSIQGGTEKTRYLTSIGYYDQKGIIKNNDLNRFTTLVNLDQNFNNWLSGGLSMNISQVKMNNAQLGTGGNETAGIIRSAIQFNPLIPIYDKNGKFNLDPGQGFLPNPVSLLDIKDETTNQRALMNAFVQVEPIKGFTVKTMLGADKKQSLRNYYMPTTVLQGAREGGFASKNQKSSLDYTFNIVANWKKNFNNIHDLAVTAGYEFQKFTWDNMGMDNSRFIYDGGLWNNIGSGSRDKPGVSSAGGVSRIASYISRVNYNLLDRYLLTVNFRMDGSSNFAEKHRWGYFPGVSLGWKIHEESFLKHTSSWLSELKLRVGYGQTGNDDVNGIYTYYSADQNAVLGGKITNGVGLAALGNPNLKWETQTDINIGLDWGLWNGRLSGTIEVFDRKITDILGDKKLASYQQVNVIKANLDAIKQTQGIEFSFGSRNIVKQNFRWSTDFNFTYYRDRWNKRDPSFKPDINESEKQTFNEMWYYLADGLVQPSDTEYIKNFGAIPGTVKIKDTNGYLTENNGDKIFDANGKPQYLGSPDGKIDKADLVRIGVNIPFTVGLNNSFTFKNLDLNIFFYGMFNRWKTNDTKVFYFGDSFRLQDGANMFYDVKNRWSYKNMTSTEPSIFQTKAKYGTGNYYLENAWFIRCRNITLGYTLPEKVTKKIFSSLRIFADAQNLFVISPYSGSDPETDEMAAYPNQRTFSLGIDIKF